MKRKYKQLSFEKRVQMQQIIKDLTQLKGGKINISYIARELGVSRQTIYYEPDKNGPFSSPLRYCARSAQEKRDKRKTKSIKKHKIENQTQLKNFIHKALSEYHWSPEIISQKVNEYFNGEISVSKETIYQYILQNI